MIKKIFFCFLIGMGSLSAQSFSGKINPFPSVSSRQPGDSIRILAVMVEYQEDKDGSTFGNGKFGSIYTSDYGSSIIDPLPHDKIYFESHFEFIKNYYAKVSGGKSTVSFTVLPDIITLSKTMRNYSPPPRSSDLTPLGDFAKEVWFKADSIYNNFNFADYDLFLIFHAGVGRDISLPGSLGLERDLPSVYLGPEGLKKIYGSEFNGFPVSSGTFNIMNSAIMPETESRELSSSISGTVLFELSINGLLAATVASYLGLPDLFDTETGLSAIGRFGLMDGQSIFAYNGLFPPEPGPWEKYFLGWLTPSERSINKSDYTLVPKLLESLSDTSVLKVPLSSSEYFLIENRQRDVNLDGSIVTYVSEGVVKTKTFTKDTTGFYSFDIDSLEGVVIDVDEFDWALPGSGILIWHIDEDIIAANISENKVNADEKLRGVDVEEADGVQDIGVEFQTVFGDVIVGEGEQRDFWYSSNQADLYVNKFNYETRPGTISNTGANPLLQISNFSEISNRMSFRIEYGDSIIKPIASTVIPIISPNAVLTTFGNDLLLTSENQGFLVSREGAVKDSLEGFSLYKPAVFNTNNTRLAIGVSEDIIIYEGGPGTEHTSKPDLQIKQIPGVVVTCSPVIFSSEKFLVGHSNGIIYTYGFGDTFQPVIIDSLAIQGASEILQIAVEGNYITAIVRKGSEYALTDNTGSQLSIEAAPGQLILTKNSIGEYISIVSLEDKILIISKGRISTVIQKENKEFSGLAVTDLKHDGNNYITFNDGSKLKVINLNGVSADNFPFVDPLGRGFDRFVMAGDFEGSSASEIIAVTKDGRIFGIDGISGKVISGFPLSAGKKLKGYPVLYNTSGNTLLSVIDTSNNFYTWNISSIPGTLYWSELYRDNTNASFSTPALNNNFVSDFFPSQKVYNYPNPVYDGRTFIRYYVSEASKINIKIFDLAGTLVTELNSEAQGGSDNETEWDVSGVQSGVYLARVEASNSSGKKETNFIKIAVVK